MWKKNKNNFERSASLPTRSKNKPPPILTDTPEDGNWLSPEERDKAIHDVLKEIKGLAIFAKDKYNKERKKRKQTQSYVFECQTLIQTSIPKLKELLGISTHDEQRAREQFLAEEENFRHNTNRDLRKWNTAFNEKKKYEDEIQSLHKRHKEEMRNIQKEHESILRRLREKEKSVQSLEAEKENLLTRLSQVAGAKLRDNNPAISDLSDPNRPLKLVEKISELYDNEWTDAIEILETDTNERMAIESLLNILKNCFDVCRYYAELQLKIIRTALELEEKLHPDPILVGKCAKDLQKSASTFMINDSSLITIVCNHISKSVGQIVERCKPFVNKCVQYCWLMCIQDPPIHMITFNRGMEYNANEMRTFTKTGKFVDFVVWPAFLLYEKGPLLSKAIIQGMNELPQNQGRDQSTRKDFRGNGRYEPIREAQIMHTRRKETQNEYHSEQVMDRENPDALSQMREIGNNGGAYSAKIKSNQEYGQNYSYVPSDEGKYTSFHSPNPYYEKREPQRESGKTSIPATVYKDTSWYKSNPSYHDPYGESQYHHNLQPKHTNQSPSNTNQVAKFAKYSESALPTNNYRPRHQPFSKTYNVGSHTYKSTEL